jgi:hypothetical protein
MVINFRRKILVDINDFERQEDCVYKSELYSVRDNGAVFRHSRKNKPLRKLDNQWTFGTLNNYGYLLISSEVVHRIVAYAFLGEPPSVKQNIVDHIDTNRQNNRPENLRWLTKLENILLNPITYKRIIFHCESIEAFLENPAILKDCVDKDPNFEWMRAVTPEEAQTSWNRLQSWANKEYSDPSSKEAKLGEWIFGNGRSTIPTSLKEDTIISKTPNAIQKNWKTPSEFPHCPQTFSDHPIETYLNNLEIGSVFSSNQISNSIVKAVAISEDKTSLWIKCKSSDGQAIKPWSVALVTIEKNLYVHTSLGSFFKGDGAEKAFTLAQGLEWTGGDTFDDFA